MFVGFEPYDFTITRTFFIRTRKINIYAVVDANLGKLDFGYKIMLDVMGIIDLLRYTMIGSHFSVWNQPLINSGPIPKKCVCVQFQVG